MSLDDSANLVWVPGHKGPHPEQYHAEVFSRLGAATQECQGIEQCKAMLTAELRSLATELTTPGTTLHRLVTQSASR